MKQLTAKDRLMLWPDELWPQDIGTLAVLQILREASGRPLGPCSVAYAYLFGGLPGVDWPALRKAD